MSSKLCKNCGKPPLAERAGSVTSYFFQHNYCQCAVNRKEITEAGQDASPVCANCGKSRPTNSREGSFTSFLFQELRCSCSGSSPKASANSGRQRSQTHTAQRLAQKKQYTESLRKHEPNLGEPAAQMILAKGTIIGGNYSVVSQIGLGGMSVVYLVEQAALNKQFALKVLDPALVNENNWLRFKAEAKTMASLHHPSFVNVYDLGIHKNSIPFYSMDYLNGRTLEEILIEEGPLKLEAALNIFIEVLNGLAYAHRHGIIHRDIKPANIMLCNTNGVIATKILDFGISKLISSDSSNMQSMTMAGDVFGSPFYMSPEQCAGKPIDARSDIYSIGCSLFEVLTGYVPFEGTNSLDTILMHQEDNPPRLSNISPNQYFPHSLEAVLATCLAKLPRERYQSAKELAIDLEKIKSGKDIQASSPAFHQLNKLVERGESEGRTEDEGRREDDANNSEYLGSSSKNLTKTIFLSTAVIAVLVLTLAGVLSLTKTVTPVDITTHKNELEPLELNNVDAAVVENALDKTNKNSNLPYSRIINNGNTIQFSFPEYQSIGTIGLAATLQNQRQAQSTVEFPAKSELQFHPAIYAFSHPEVFDCFRPTNLVSLSTPTEQKQPLHLKKVLPHIAKLTALRRLTFFATNIGDEELVELNTLPNLEDLNLDATKVTPVGLSKLKRLKNLRSLRYGTSTSAGHSILLKALQGSQALETLALDSLEAPLTEADARMICSCKNIRTLGLQASIATDKVLLILSALPNLENIDIQYCIVSKEAVEKFKKAALPRKVTVLASHQTNTAPAFASEKQKEWSTKEQR